MLKTCDQSLTVLSQRAFDILSVIKNQSVSIDNLPSYLLSLANLSSGIIKVMHPLLSNCYLGTLLELLNPLFYHDVPGDPLNWIYQLSI